MANLVRYDSFTNLKGSEVKVDKKARSIARQKADLETFFIHLGKKRKSKAKK